MPDSLNRVAVENFSVCVRDGGKGFDGLNRADFVIGEHDGNDFRLRQNCFTKIFRINRAEFVDG